jgi:pimeloyl-ACP methyl ester carboxylesterase
VSRRGSVLNRSAAIQIIGLGQTGFRMNTSSHRGQAVPINGIEMYYETHGQGEPLVLLHGFTGSGDNWEPFRNDLAREHRLVIPDLRGHGRSTNPSMEFTFRQSALDVSALLDRLDIGRFKAMGTSGGGNTLLHMATQQPDRVVAMVLISAAPYFPEQARTIMRQFTIDSRTEDEWQRMRQWHAYGDEQIRALWMLAHAFKDSYNDMNFTPPCLSRITARTLILHGDRDPLYPVTIPLELLAAIPRSYLWIVPNGGHCPIFGDLANPFVETALAFLRGDWDRP